MFIAGLRAIDDITATAAGKVLVFEIYLYDWTAAFADEGWPRISEACFDPLKLEALHAITMEELYHRPIDFHTCEMRIA